MTPEEMFAVRRLGSRWAVISGGAIFAYARRRDDALRLANAADKVLSDSEAARQSTKPERPPPAPVRRR